ncbi:serpin family protein [Microscilla marina]|uniref:Serpin (Serine proteinase inhibitor) n=1 Tax=Microscilla marina ATCC 23134 TaxID=313606 RepID=A1ZJC2_MICM2|nr:serpin family protein [Microscilla marina]EAY29658.1 serpin (serine proteinase inhibitor) [Microscilla marina ATCC 23134]
MQKISQKLLCLQIAKQGYSNLLFSPLSLEVLLGLALPGTQGASRQALLQALEITEEEVNSYLAELQVTTESLLGIAKPATEYHHNYTQVQLANSLWYAAHVQVHPHYARTLNTRFPMEWFALDDPPPTSIDRINQWANEQTNGMIPQLPIPLHEQTVAVLLSALYLKGFWSREFSEIGNSAEFFYKLDGSEDLCEYMNITQDTDEGRAEAYYLKKDRFHALRLMLNDGRIGLEVYLPYEKAGLADFINPLQGHELDAWQEEFVPAPYFYFLLPKFETTSSIQLAEFAEQMGLEALFAASDDFAPMLDSAELLKVDDIAQEVKVKVTKEGLEAAAVSYMVAVGGAAFYEEPERHEMIIFEADHPFLYRIVDTVTQKTLFQGIFTTPVHSKDVFLEHFNQRTYKVYDKNLADLSGQERFVFATLLLELTFAQHPLKYDQVQVFIEQIWAELATEREFDNQLLVQDFREYIEMLLNIFEEDELPAEGKFAAVAEEVSRIFEDILSRFVHLFEFKAKIYECNKGNTLHFIQSMLKTNTQLPNYAHTVGLIRARQKGHSVQRIGIDALHFDEVPTKIVYTEEEKREQAEAKAEIELAQKINRVDKAFKVGFVTYALTRLRTKLGESSTVMDKIMVQMELYIQAPNPALKDTIVEIMAWATQTESYHVLTGFDTKDRLQLKLLRKKHPELMTMLSMVGAEFSERGFWEVYDATQTNELLIQVNSLLAQHQLALPPLANLVEAVAEMPKGTVFDQVFFEEIEDFITSAKNDLSQFSEG